MGEGVRWFLTRAESLGLETFLFFFFVPFLGGIGTVTFLVVLEEFRGVEQKSPKVTLLARGRGLGRGGP